jgi:hypothetical protein
MKEKKEGCTMDKETKRSVDELIAEAKDECDREKKNKVANNNNDDDTQPFIEKDKHKEISKDDDDER